MVQDSDYWIDSADLVLGDLSITGVFGLDSGGAVNLPRAQEDRCEARSVGASALERKVN